jgi:hypothetical protein
VTPEPWASSAHADRSTGARSGTGRLAQLLVRASVSRPHFAGPRGRRLWLASASRSRGAFAAARCGSATCGDRASHPPRRSVAYASQPSHDAVTLGSAGAETAYNAWRFVSRSRRVRALPDLEVNDGTA